MMSSSVKITRSAFLFIRKLHNVVHCAFIFLLSNALWPFLFRKLEIASSVIFFRYICFRQKYLNALSLSFLMMSSCSFIFDLLSVSSVSSWFYSSLIQRIPVWQQTSSTTTKSPAFSLIHIGLGLEKTLANYIVPFVHHVSCISSEQVLTLEHVHL